MCPRSSFPLRRLGVPTQRKEISLFRTAVSAELVACSRSALRVGDNFAYPWFDDGAISRIHGLDLGPAQIDANDIVAPVGHTGGGYRANVSQAEYANGAIHAFGRISSKLTLGMRIKDQTPEAQMPFPESALLHPSQFIFSDFESYHGVI